MNRRDTLKALMAAMPALSQSTIIEPPSGSKSQKTIVFLSPKSPLTQEQIDQWEKKLSEFGRKNGVEFLIFPSDVDLTVPSEHKYHYSVTAGCMSHSFSCQTKAEFDEIKESL